MQIPLQGVLVCPTCHHRDSGVYCSKCGEVLVPAGKSISHSVWEHVLLERLVDALALVKTSWLIIVAPVAFFREVLQQNGHLAQRRFFLTPLWDRISQRPQKVLDPVKYLVLATGLTVVLGWFSSASQSVLPEGAPRWAEELLPLLTVVFQVLWLSLYSHCLSLMLGGRVGGADLTRFMLYLSGLTTLLGAFLTLFGSSEAAGYVAVVTLLLALFVAVVVPYVALPRLYGITRTRLFAAQLGAFALITGGFVILFMIVYVIAAAGA